LVQWQESVPRLTNKGRQYALRLIRIHRLWEHYLAERTGISESEWHGQADQREHRMSSDQANALAAAMGHPRFDPHGDPIPTADGEVPPLRGLPLSVLTAGQRGLIVHVEDEPENVYAELLEHGLSRGMRLSVMENNADGVRIDVDGRTCVLSPLAAANLSVESLPSLPVEAAGTQRLSDIELGQSATILDLLPACRGDQRRRLLDLGLVPGTVVEAELRSPGGDPTAYRIRGALFALRRDQTDLVRVNKVTRAAEASP
jgi:DtxR family Mn-dependent transcriptional regulator